MTKTPRTHRVVILLSDDELKVIEDWRFEKRIATRAETIRQLCRRASSCPASVGASEE